MKVSWLVMVVIWSELLLKIAEKYLKIEYIEHNKNR